MKEWCYDLYSLLPFLLMEKECCQYWECSGQDLVRPDSSTVIPAMALLTSPHAPCRGRNGYILSACVSFRMENIVHLPSSLMRSSSRAKGRKETGEKMQKGKRKIQKANQCQGSLNEYSACVHAHYLEMS